MIHLIYIFLLSLLTVGSTFADIPVATIDADTDVSSHNSCSTDSSELECIRAKLERLYAYTPTTKPDSVVPDKLSDADISALTSTRTSSWLAANQGTLKQVLLIHRHGDRTPIVFPSKDNLANESFWNLHGLGQLTNRGKARLHLLGAILRHRYDRFLQGSVNKNIRKSKSSGALRCIESAQVFLSSFLSLTEQGGPDAESLIWDKGTNKLSQLWQPASINTMASKYDALLYEGAQCKSTEAEYAALDDSDAFKKLMEEYRHESEVLEREYGFVVDHFYKWFWASSQLEVEESYFGPKLKPAIKAIYNRVQEAGDKALVIFQSSQKLRRLRVGLLIDDMIKNMVDYSKLSSSPYSKKFVHYSAHDVNLVFLLGAFENFQNFPYRPDYAASLMLELHEDQGEWFVKLFYMPHVPSKISELHIPACEQGHEQKRCTLNKFSDLMQKYRVPSWSSWMQECGNSVEDVNPYEQNS